MLQSVRAVDVTSSHGRDTTSDHGRGPDRGRADDRSRDDDHGHGRADDEVVTTVGDTVRGTVCDTAES